MDTFSEVRSRADATEVPHVHGWYGALRAARVTAERQNNLLDLTTAESARFFRVLSAATQVRRHEDAYEWLSGELQQFLPHEILVSSWGDFARRELQVDVTSGLPGVRTAQLAHCSIDGLLEEAYAGWTAGGYRPLLIKVSDGTQAVECTCPLHAALRRMRSLVVHGFHDRRSGHHSLYVAMSSGSPTRGRCKQRFLALAEVLIAQIDGAFRKIPAFPQPIRSSTREPRVLDLSEREREVLESVRVGKTNDDIALALEISPFTVKNHVQRIFRKMGVTNRTQAAARYMEALREVAAQDADRPRCFATKHEGLCGDLAG